MQDIKIKSIRKMVVADWKDFSDEVKDYLFITEIYESKDEEVLNECLDEMDFVVITISIKEKEYTIYHGFPGDNYFGVLMKGKKIVTNFGEAIKNKYSDEYKNIAEVFLKWYNEDSDNISCKLFTLKKNND